MHLRNIPRIRRTLNQQTTEILVHSLVSSCLDYANSVLAGVSKQLVQKLQRVQNAAARIVCQVSRACHITPVLKKLHWLPVYKRIEFKLLLTTFKVLNGHSPSYLNELLEPYEPTRCLRSGQQRLLKVPPTKLRTFGDRAFCFIAPKLWNKLPIHLRTITSLEVFKHELKTHLFMEHYNTP